MKSTLDWDNVVSTDSSWDAFRLWSERAVRPELLSDGGGVTMFSSSCVSSAAGAAAAICHADRNERQERRRIGSVRVIVMSAPLMDEANNEVLCEPATIAQGKWADHREVTVTATLWLDHNRKSSMQIIQKTTHPPAQETRFVSCPFFFPPTPYNETCKFC